MMGKTLKNKAFLSVGDIRIIRIMPFQRFDFFLDMFEKIVYTVYAVEGKE